MERVERKTAIKLKIVLGLNDLVENGLVKVRRICAVKRPSLSLLNRVKLQQRLPDIIISLKLKDDLADASRFLLL